MPHLLETYALNCGAKIDKPYIYDSYISVAADKYITLQPFSRFEGKRYDFWDEVIDYIHPALSERGIKVVQLGMAEDMPIEKCVHMQGKTTVNQAAYVVKNSIMHVGTDSFLCHIASGFDKKIVSLYSTNYSAVCRPYWSRSEDLFLLEPDRNKYKPAFAQVDNPKQINFIKPEEVAEAVFKALGIDEKIKYKSIYTGQHYHFFNLQSIPSSPARINQEIPLSVRMDIEFNEGNLAKQLQLTVCNVITNKPINIDLLKSAAANKRINEIVYYLDENHSPEFAEEINSLGVTAALMTKMEDDELEKIKLDYLDYGFINQEKRLEEDVAKIKSQSLDKLYFRTKKKIFKDGSIYNSIASLKNNVPLAKMTDTAPIKIFDCDEFWDDLQHFNILEKLD